MKSKSTLDKIISDLKEESKRHWQIAVVYRDAGFKAEGIELAIEIVQRHAKTQRKENKKI